VRSSLGRKRGRRRFSIRLVNEQAGTAREIERVRTAGVIGLDYRGNAGGRKRGLSQLRIAPAWVDADLDHV
jgi:hypothetical protein